MLGPPMAGPESAISGVVPQASRAAEGRLLRLVMDAPNLPAARNRAVEETTCDIIRFIDDDVEIPPGFVELPPAEEEPES